MAKAKEGIVGSMRRGIASLLSKEPPPPVGRAGGVAGALSAKFRPPLALDQFQPALGALTKQHIQLLAGHVHFTGLEEIKQLYGDGWSAMAGRAHDVACRAIERRLSESDIYVKASELQYLIIFANVDKVSGQLKCALIADEIKRILIGEDSHLGTVEVETAVGDVREGLHLEAVPNLDTLVAETKVTAAQDEAASAKTAPANDVNVDNPEYILRDVQLVFRPSWQVRKNALSMFQCVPALAYPGGHVMLGEASIPRLNEPAVAFALNQRCLRYVIDLQQRLTSEGRRLLIMVPVDFETLASSARRATYFDLCKQIPPLAHKLLVFELIHAPNGVPQGRLLECTSLLRQYARAIIMRVPLATTVFHTFGQTGMIGVNTVIEEAAGSERQIIAAMQRFTTESGKLGLVSCIQGLRSLSLTAAAIGAGFHYIGGDVVTSIVNFPRDIRAFNPKDLYARFLPKPP